MELLPDDVTLEIADLASIPLYNNNVFAANMPEPALELRQKIAHADALLLATPEYNYSIPAVLKNACGRNYTCGKSRSTPICWC